jgi:hypothetical protein
MMIDTPERAKRLARTIVSDIALYNRELIKQGIENDNLFSVLAEDLEKGRKLYDSRVSPDLLKTTSFYNQAIVDVLVKQYGNLASKIW